MVVNLSLSPSYRLKITRASPGGLRARAGRPPGGGGGPPPGFSRRAEAAPGACSGGAGASGAGPPGRRRSPPDSGDGGDDAVGELAHARGARDLQAIAGTQGQVD